MPWPFGQKRNQAEDEEFIRHCQLLFAYQQHSMEVFNDAMAKAAAVEGPADFIERYGVNLNSPMLVDMYLLPAVQKKQALVAQMRALQDSYPPPTHREHRRIYELADALVDAIEVRAAEQEANIERWVSDPDFNPSEMTNPETDANEQAALMAMLIPLNRLIEKAGFAGPPFLSINCEVFNEARRNAGLPPLLEEEFIRRYFAGLSGARVRFFDE